MRSPRCASAASRSTAGRFSATWPRAGVPAGGHTRTAALALVAALLIGSSATAQDWTRFRGPGGQGHGEGTAIPSSFDAKAYRWRVELAGPGHSSPVVWGERLFLTTADPEAGKRWIVCHGTGDGAELWRTEVTFEAHGQHRLNSFASSTPAAAARRARRSAAGAPPSDAPPLPLL